eukprot:6175733-Alexandrium_andersonii.AAC.1
MQLQRVGEISSMSLCIVLLSASLAGVASAKLLAMPPGRPTGRYQHHIDAVLGRQTPTECYALDVPGHAKHDVSRTSHSMPVLPPHECIDAE